MTYNVVTRDHVLEAVIKRKIKDFIKTTENHGGYTAGFCIVCNSTGWVEHLEKNYKNHTPTCPVGLALVPKLDPDNTTTPG